MKVIVATYEHRYGTDTRVFANAELAWAWRIELADEWWDEHSQGDKPEDRTEMARRYWETVGDNGSEFFNYDAFDVEGLPDTADSPTPIAV